MSELMFYGKPVALNRNQHKQLGFKPYRRFGFAAQINSTPLAGVEFFEASRDYPILFKPGAGDEFFALALLSLSNQHNSQLDDEGQWKNSYIPAFVRRYPFALTGDGTVCFDEQADAFAEQASDDYPPLFDEDGNNGAPLDNIIRFLQQYDAEIKRSREFCQALQAQDLLRPFNVQLAKDQQAAVRLEGLFIIDEQKLNALDDATISDWFRKGWIAWSYAHLHSLGALTRLLNNSPLSGDKPTVQ
ncbi:MAG TPA: SapC family protein [Pseudomonadales bacterium]